MANNASRDLTTADLLDAIYGPSAWRTSGDVMREVDRRTSSWDMPIGKAITGVLGDYYNAARDAVTEVGGSIYPRPGDEGRPEWIPPSEDPDFERKLGVAGIGTGAVLGGTWFGAPRGALGAGPARGMEPTLAPPLDGGFPAPKLSRPKGREAVKSGRGSEDRMMEGAKKGSHLKRKPDGKYVGAPEDIRSPQALSRMRRELDRLVDEGEVGSSWYAEGRNAVREMTGDDPRANAVTANTLGITSPQSKPDPNLGTTLRGLVNYAVTGDVPPIVRTGAQANAIREQIATGGESRKGLGAKTGVFADTLNPDREGMFVGSTNDVWHSRAFGHSNADGSPYSGTPTAQMHAFMDNETALAALRARDRGLDVAIPDVQARIWFAKKIEDAMASGLSREEAAQKVMAESGSFRDYLDKYTVYGTHEFLPGGATGHLAGLEANPDLLSLYYGNPATTWATAPGGRDAIYGSMDLMPVRPTQKMSGAWEDPVKGFQSNPGETARPMVPLVRGEGLSHAIDPAVLPAIEGAEILRGYLGAQSGAATHRLGGGQSGQLNAVDVPMNRPLTTGEVLALAEKMNERGYHVSDRGSGATITNFYGEKGPPEVKGDFSGIRRDVRDVLPDAGEPIRRHLTSTYGDLDFSVPGSGTATRQMLDAMDAVPEFGRRAMSDSPMVRERADAMANRDELLAARSGLPLREDIQRARRLFAEGGIELLRKALAKGELLPAAAVAVVGLDAVLGKDGDEQ